MEGSDFLLAHLFEIQIVFVFLNWHICCNLDYFMQIKLTMYLQNVIISGTGRSQLDSCKNLVLVRTFVY